MNPPDMDFTPEETGILERVLVDLKDGARLRWEGIAAQLCSCGLQRCDAQRPGHRLAFEVGGARVLVQYDELRGWVGFYADLGHVPEGEPGRDRLQYLLEQCADPQWAPIRMGLHPDSGHAVAFAGWPVAVLGMNPGQAYETVLRLAEAAGPMGL